MGHDESATGDLPFIISFDPTKPGESDADRKLIRSHVMKGKNKGKVYRNKGRRNKTLPEKKQQSSFEAPQSRLDVVSTAPSIPNRVGTDISLGFEPADTIEVSLLLPVCKFAGMAKRLMFALEPHILFNHETHSMYRDLLGRDAAYLNAMVYTVHLFFDMAAGVNLKAIQPPKPAYKHLSKSLSLLRERLDVADDKVRLSDSTVLAILSLAYYSSIAGQYETASNHLKGIRKIVDLRGGIIGLRRNPKLLIEMFRCDLGLALDSGSQTIFFYSPVAEPFMPYLNSLSSFIPAFFRAQVPCSMTSDDMGISDTELARSWDTTATFCSLLNYASASNRKIPQETLLNTMASVMYRLVHLSYPSGTLKEMFRLGILGFCSQIFLQRPGVRVPYRHLSTMYRSCLVNPLTDPVAPQTLLWLLFVGSITLPDQEDNHWLQPWLHATLSVCGIDSWNEARLTLKGHLWVDFLHDRLGVKMFEMVQKQPSAGV